MVEYTKATIVDRKATYGAPGTKRNEAWKALKMSKGSIAKYLAAGMPKRYLSRWASQGLIALR